MQSDLDGHLSDTGLGGLLVDLVTPLNQDRTLDRYALESLLLYLSSERFDGVVPAGTTGEGPLLSLAVRAEITRVVADTVPGFRQVVPMTLGSSPAAVLFELDALASAGATAALVSPLSYGGMDGGAMAGFFAEVLDRSPLPVVLYNAPRLTGVQIPRQVVAELAGREKVIGIADAGSDMGFLVWLVLHAQETASFRVVCCDDAGLMPAILTGAAGAVTASANLVPSLVCDVYQHSLTRSLHSARLAQRRLVSVIAACENYGLPGAWKAAANFAGLCGPTAAVAGYGLDPDDTRRLRTDLAELGVVSHAR